MTTLRLPLEVVQGTEFRRRFRAYSDFDKTLPVDFTDTAVMLVCRRRQWIGAPELFRASTDDGRIVNGGSEGWFDVVVPASGTVGLPDGDFYYWLTLWPESNSEQAACWLRGPLKVLPGVEVP